MADFTRMLNDSDDSRNGKAFEQLYGELKKIACGKMAREASGHTLSATGLVHEAWMRVEGSGPDQWRDRQQFYAAATEAMRRILVESARRRLAHKRGGGARKEPLDEVEFELFAPLPDERLIAVHEALDRLEEENPINANIVKLRYFGGMRHHEIAALLDMGETTVRRHWSVAKVWLYRALKEEL